MALVYSSVPCSEINGSRSESYSPFVGAGLTGKSQVVLRCAWNDALPLVADILGNKRPDPMRSGIFAATASIAMAGGENSGYTQDGQGLIPDYAHVTVQYGSAEGGYDPNNPNPDPDVEIVSETLEPAVEFTTLSEKGFEWDMGGVLIGAPIAAVKPEEAPGLPFFTMKLVRNWRNLTVLPTGLLTLIGKTNDGVYNSQFTGLSFPVETLMYMNPTMSHALTTGGASKWNVTTSFLYKPETHNKFRVVREGLAPDWYHLKVKGGSVFKPYPPADLRPVLGGI